MWTQLQFMKYPAKIAMVAAGVDTVDLRSIPQAGKGSSYV
jgi:hypothetical protein